MNFDPQTCPIEADLSRADVVLLCTLCKDRRIIEFGSGGSTVLLARVATQIDSYETDAHWIKLVQDRLDRETAKLCPINIHLTGQTVPKKVPRADVLFVDGVSNLRNMWVEAALQRRLFVHAVIVHDSRRPLKQLQCLLEWPSTAHIHRITYHAQDSNCLIIALRKRPVQYKNWNLTEPGHIPHLHRQGTKR